VPFLETLGRATVSYKPAVTVTFLCREPPQILGKEPFADKKFAEGPLPSAALDKAFAECGIRQSLCRAQ